MILDASLLKTQYYKAWIKSKVEHSRKRSSTLWCSRYRKGVLWVALDYSHQLYLNIYIYIYIYIYIMRDRQRNLSIARTQSTGISFCNIVWSTQARNRKLLGTIEYLSQLFESIYVFILSHRTYRKNKCSSVFILQNTTRWYPIFFRTILWITDLRSWRSIIVSGLLCLQSSLITSINNSF